MCICMNFTIFILIYFWQGKVVLELTAWTDEKVYTVKIGY